MPGRNDVPGANPALRLDTAVADRHNRRMEPLGTGDMIVRLGAAVLLCGILGLERQERGKAAGLRTLILVGLGSAAFVAAARGLAAGAGAGGAATLDGPSTISRVVQGIVGGIGFLGAGSVIRDRGAVHGMTTAATVWVTCAVGVACGLGEIVLAAVTSVLAWFTLVGLGYCEKRWLPFRNHRGQGGE